MTQYFPPTRPYRTPCLLIGNNQYGIEFFELGRRHHLDRGEISVYVVKQHRAAEPRVAVITNLCGHEKRRAE